MRTLGHRMLWLLAVALLVAGCSAAPSEEDTSGPRGTSATGATTPTGATGGTGVEPSAIDACELLAAEDTARVMGAEVELVADPFGEGLLGGDPAQFSGFCYYRPVPDDETRWASLIVFAAGFADAGLENLVADGVAMGGSGFEMWDVDGGIVVHEGDVVFAVGIVSSSEGAPDRSGALELAQLAVARLPGPAAP